MLINISILPINSTSLYFSIFLIPILIFVANDYYRYPSPSPTPVIMETTCIDLMRSFTDLFVQCCLFAVHISLLHLYSFLLKYTFSKIFQRSLGIVNVLNLYMSGNLFCFYFAHTFFFFLSVLGLHCCMWVFSSGSEWGLLSSCSAWTSHCGSFSCWGAQA